MALDGHFVSGLMHGFTGCHFGYISESVVAASEAAGLIKACLLQQLQGEQKNQDRREFSTLVYRSYDIKIIILDY